MFDYRNLQHQLSTCDQPDWAEHLATELDHILSSKKNSRLPEWADTLASLKPFKTTSIDLTQESIRLGEDNALSSLEQQQLTQVLQSLHPWRKGPFNIMGVEIDTEWRSDWKWQRLEHSLGDLAGLNLLDVGCGSGYHVLRMLGAGANSVIGIEPTLLYVAQFLALQHFAQQEKAVVLPYTLEALGNQVVSFDLVFSMGVLYHRRSPLDHLIKLRQLTHNNGRLLLETLVLEDQELLVPKGRYAQMRNVWFIPSTEQLIQWLERCGYHNCEIIDVSTTSIAEQRRTEWMTFDSLQQFLDPSDHSKTIEGYPAPRRAIILADAA